MLEEFRLVVKLVVFLGVNGVSPEAVALDVLDKLHSAIEEAGVLALGTSLLHLDRDTIYATLWITARTKEEAEETARRIAQEAVEAVFHGHQLPQEVAVT